MIGWMTHLAVYVMVERDSLARDFSWCVVQMAL